MEKIIIIWFLLLSGGLFAQNKTSEWTSSFQGVANVRAYDIVSDDLGNTFTIGVFYGTVDFDPSSSVYNLNGSANSQIFICKLDPLGNFLWVRQFSSASNPVGYSIDIDNQGDIYATGHFFTSMDMDPGAGISILSNSGRGCFVLKLNQNGIFQWARDFTPLGGAWGSGGYDIAVKDNNVYITGEYRGPYDFDSGVGVSSPPVYTSNPNIQDVFVTKFDLNGNFIWARGFGGAGGDVSRTIKADLNGNVYVFGYFTGTADFDGGAGVFNLTSGSGGTSRSCFIVKYDVSGNFVWAKALVGSLNNYTATKSLSIDVNGALYLTGYFEGTVDFDPNIGVYNLTSAGGRDGFILKILPSGNMSWANQIEGIDGIYPYGIGIESSGNIVVTGLFYGTADFDPGLGVSSKVSIGGADGFVLWLNSISGSYIEDEQIVQGPGNIIVRAISVNSANDTFLAGYFESTADFKPTCLSLSKSALNYDAFVLKINECLSVLPIELSFFKAILNNNNNVYVFWETISEINNAYFIIEKSINGKEWIELDKVVGKGNSQEIEKYSVIDFDPFNGISYYRLKQVDFDGMFTFSKIIAVNNSVNIESVNLYPNPSSGNSFLTINSVEHSKDEIATIKVLNMSGKLIFEDRIKLSKLKMNYSLLREEIEAGMYTVIIAFGDNKIFKKWMIVDN